MTTQSKCERCGAPEINHPNKVCEGYTPPQGDGWDDFEAEIYPWLQTKLTYRSLLLKISEIHKKHLSSQRTLLREKIEASKVDVRRDKVSSSKGAHSEHDSLFDLGWNAALAHFATLHDEI